MSGRGGRNDQGRMTNDQWKGGGKFEGGRLNDEGGGRRAVQM